jgi:hypothetical protein
MGDSSSVYATARPLEGSVVDLMNGQEVIQIRRQDMRAERENEFARQDIARKALTDKNNDDVDKRYGTAIKSEGTFTTNVQELNMNTISTLSKRLQEVTDKIKDPSLSEAERNKYRVEADAIHNSPASIKTAGENLATAYASHLKDVDDGKAYLNTKLRDAATLGYGATAIWDSEKNQVVYAVKQKGEDGAMVDQDTNKDGKIDSLDYVTINDLIADTGKFQTNPKYKVKDTDSAIFKGIQEVTIKGDDGTNTWNNKGAAKEQVLEKVKNTLLTPRGTLNPIGYSYAIEKGYNPNDPDSIKKMVEETTNVHYNSFDKIVSNGKRTSDATIANQNKESVREGYTQVVYDGELQYNPDGSPMMKKSVSTTKKVAVTPKAEKPKANSGFDANAFYKKHKKK